MKNILIYGGMLFSIIGMTSFDNILVLKYLFKILALKKCSCWPFWTSLISD